MVNDFLHKINLDALKKETNMSLAEIAELAGIRDPKNLGKWMQEKDKGGSRPNYNAIAKLFEKGATVETLFGVEYEKKVLEKSKKNPDLYVPEFFEGLQKSIDAKVDSAMDKRLEYILRAKGIIK